MSASSTGSLRHSSGPGGYRHGPSRGSSQKLSYEERCVDPEEERLPTPEPKSVHKAHLKDANGKESETIGFIPGSADSRSAAQTCNPCASPRSCSSFVCSVLTCGLYRVCQRTILAPCLAPNERSPDEPEKVSLQSMNPGDNKVEDGTDWLGDVHIAGVKVESPREYLDVEAKSPTYVPRAGGQMQPTSPSLHESMRFDDWEEGEEDVDSLITKKLLELYSEYQIEELARCTSDSVFLRKSKAINQLINSLAEEHKMDEQEAECRLVRGIIRISTRKSTKRRPPISKRERTLSDSGNETMRESESFSFSNNNDYKSNPNIQISELTSSDKCAREMWKNNGGEIHLAFICQHSAA
ncbi:keratinocyte differentiation factor 1 isoform X2 [Toxotes jaculatrix]|uniref:keratinocyte differentiation factor 1 isoform X2 n=1 Tax=Toxotes jaculatrix TaxID=941984 RepID=UPI001B3AE2B8|nr:keratinocyte differentiation factor 1 isoform X2 [Toxotes jaculatrix]